jgi:hypothetical protein
MCHALSVGGERAMISMVRYLHSIHGATPRHSIVMEACPPHHDDVASRPFVRTGRWNSVPHCGNRGDCKPRGGSGCLVEQVDSGVSVEGVVGLWSTWPRGRSACKARPAPDLISRGK